ncbi:hypothetical protein LYSHEL_12830 [Lysobacter helvus]|uniref:DUF6531 domain-containing protein n=2 Tax=Lysobacteraceae TaxID=32033 RepID=A0ABM7Q4M2_9GAMM|nr:MULTISPECIES: DUF6531 domain-containing protein [Lysobacter]BCT92259.1 hypothetical protein LYSCAS_12830 [Lysobacter caseinilyticus]BCT95412.1 hypothetical protein LYSHEL_12830 [Lysobacter helvus]
MPGFSWSGNGNGGGGGGFSEGAAGGAAGGDDESEDENRCDNPVDIVTGKKYDDVTDFVVAGSEGLGIHRTYHQGWRGVGMLGNQWISNHDLKLSFDALVPGPPSSTQCYPYPGGPACNVPLVYVIYAHREAGDLVRFNWNGTSNAWLGSEEHPLARITTVAGGYFLEWPDGGSEHYDTRGLLMWRLQPDGTGLYYTYDAARHLVEVRHTSGRSIRLSHQNNRLVEVVDSSGVVYRYAHAGGRLASVTYPDGKGNLGYHYDNGKLSGISVAGVRKTYYTYQGDRVVESRKADGTDLKRYAYFADRTERTNALGRKTTYRIVDGRIIEITGHATVHCPSSFSKRTFDAEGRLDTITDEAGVVTDFDYDTHGRLLKRTEALGTAVARTTRLEWDANGRLARHLVEGVSDTRYAYTAEGRPATTTQWGVGASTGQATGTSSTYTHHPNRMVATLVVDGPLAGAGDAVTYAYNSAGDLLSVSNSLGHVTRYEQYDAMGRPGRVVDPNGAVREFEYDARGRATAERLRADGQVAETRHEYNAAGLLAATTTPEGNRRQFHYDVAERLQAEFEQASDGRFDVRRVSYNPESQVAGIKVERADLHPFPVHAAQFVAQSVPGAMLGGTAYWITVQVRNTSNVPWRVQDGYRLRSANSEAWGLPHGVALDRDVAPGAVATIAFAATAPRVTTSLTFQWRMTKSDGTAFGEATTAVALPPPVVYRAELVSHDVPGHVFHGQTSWISVRVRNTGSHPWNLAPDPTVVLAQNNAQHPMPPRTYASGVIHPGQVATLTYAFNPPPGSQYHHFGGVVWMENVQALVEVPVKSMYVEDVTRRPCGAGPCEQPR